LVYVAAAVVVAVAGTVAVLLIPDRSQSPPDGGSPARGDFTATSPWRLVIRDDSNSDTGWTGCSVTLTQTDGAEKLSITGLYGTKSYQIPYVGSFRWEANDPGCLVIQHSGPGKAVLPFVQQAYTGDTDAFTAPKATGEITVEVLNFQGGTRCDFQLKDVADGRAVDFGTVNQGDRPLPLDTSGRSQVYLQEVNCAVRVSAR
jgi:hypothetical protein